MSAACILARPQNREDRAIAVARRRARGEDGSPIKFIDDGSAPDHIPHSWDPSSESQPAGTSEIERRLMAASGAGATSVVRSPAPSVAPEREFSMAVLP